MNKYLQPISFIDLGPTNGTYNYKTAEKVFAGGVDQDFVKWRINFSGITPRIRLAIDGIAANGIFTHFFGETAEELDKQKVAGAQFLHLFDHHPAKIFNSEEVLAAFAVLTANDDKVKDDLSNVFVGCVSIYAINLYACIHPLRCERGWRGANSYKVLRPAEYQF